MRPSKFVWILLALGSTLTARAHSPAEEMTEAAGRLLAALPPPLQSKAVYPIDHDERLNWHFIPRERRGVSLGELNPGQRHLVTGLLGTALSQRGLLKATAIMSLEPVLADIEKGSGPVRDAERYFVTVFGKPSTTAVWGWRFEGHHLALNFTLIPGQPIAVTPSMFGSNPAEVRTGPRQGLRILATEEDLGRQLVRSLDADQLARALLPGDVPRDIILTAGRKAELLEPHGLPVSALNASQRKLSLQLLEEYVRRYRAELADEDLRRIDDAGFDKITFAWAGGTNPGQGHYYRLQGPTFVLEYDNTQNNANHIHAVWRDLERDFGQDLLRRHYETSPHHHDSPRP